MNGVPKLLTMQKLRLASLRRKALIAIAGIVVVLFIFGGMASLISMHARSQTRQYFKDQARLDVLASQIQSDFYAYDDQMNMYALVAESSPKNRSLLNQTYQQAVAARNQLLSDLKEALSLPAPKDVVAALKRAQADAFSYSRYASQVNQAIVAGNIAKGVYIQTIGNLAPSNDIMVALAKLQSGANSYARAALSQVKSTAATSAITTTAGVVATLAMLIGIYLAFSKLVMNPLDNLVDVLNQLAEGSHGLERVDDSRSDEFGGIARAFNRFNDRLSGLIRGFADSVGTLLEATNELEDVAGSLSTQSKQGLDIATSSSSAVEEVTSNFATLSVATEQMKVAISEIARSATEAASVAGMAVDIARETSNTVSALGDASKEVSQVVDTITSIAEQTNLLALNAAIEAARAGEAGKGFAVVASEVKELARNTSKATGEIAERLESIGTESLAAVDAIGKISQVIKEINDLQTSIASAVEEQSVTTGEISRIAEESTVGAKQLAEAVGRVQQSSRASDAAVAEAEQVIERLSQLADTIGKLVGANGSEKRAQRSRFGESRNGDVPRPEVAVVD
jgi:methyl-accepting chemotaxis protein